MEIKKVYLAGKISRYDWRQNLIDIRNNFFGNEKEKIRNGMTLKYNDYIKVTGPFFLACDHGCYHGDNSHGVGLSNYYDNGDRYDCYGESDHFTKSEVKQICLKQIQKSDIIFAYINDNTCYGTLFEIGYAQALGKKIVILFDSMQRMSDMWFIIQNANYVDVCLEEDLKDEFDRIIYKL